MILTRQRPAEAAQVIVRPSPWSRVDRDAGDALKRFGEVIVREVGDILGHDHVDDPFEFRFWSSEAVSDWRKPVTTMSPAVVRREPVSSEPG